MCTSRLAEVSGTGDPNAAKIGPEDIHHIVGDLLEFLLQFSRAQQSLLKLIQPLLALQ
jgi:hypothetical protein